MLIEGPLKIAVLEQPELSGRELHIRFSEKFQQLEQNQQTQAMTDYLQQLQLNIAKLDAADANRAGMLIVQQITEQLLPHVAGGELELAETIVVEIGRDYSSDSLMGLLNS